MRPRQESLIPRTPLETARHGGATSTGRRKSRRPLDPRQSLHVVFRSSRARGEWSLLDRRHCANVHAFTHRLAARLDIRIHRFANVGSHIHLLIRARSRRHFQRFLRELAGGIAMIVTGARKGIPLKKPGASRAFWDHLVFTRIVSLGRDFANVMRYLIKNLFEAEGVPMRRLLAQGYRIITIRGAPPEEEAGSPA